MFSNISDVWSHDPVKEMTEKIKKSKIVEKFDSTISLSDSNLLSKTKEEPFTPLQNRVSESPESTENCHKLDKNHLKKCEDCHHRIKKLVDRKVNDKLNNIVLDEKIKILNNGKNNMDKKIFSLSWKEIIIIIFIIIFIIIVIVVIIKLVDKK